MTAYELYKQLDGSSSQSLLYSGTTRSFTGTIGVAGTSGVVRVRACNATGCSAYAADAIVVHECSTC